MNAKKIFIKLWNSPTITTWLSFSIKSIPFILVLPLMLSRLEASTINVWNLFISIITIQNMIDIGFGSTFVRGFAYVKGGVDDFSDNSTKTEWDIKPKSKDKIFCDLLGTMNLTYKVLFLIQFIFAGGIGTYLLIKPIEMTNNVSECWYTWCVILMTSGFALFSRKKINILLGFNFVALQKRADAVINFCFLSIAIICFYFTNSIFYFILISQLYHVINFFILGVLVNNRIEYSHLDSKFSKEVFKQIWPSAWKSFLGVLFSSGLAQFTNLLYAQHATAVNSAIYGIYLRVVTGISSFSQAPFYSKIPFLSILRAKKQVFELYDNASKFMFRSFVVFVLGVIVFELFGLPVFNFLGKDIQLNSPWIFYILVFAFFFERYGAMHIQLISTSNKIIWHIANGFCGLFICLFIWIFKNTFGVLVFPIGLFIGNLFIYMPIALFNSWKLNKVGFLKREIRVVSVFLLVLMLIFVIQFYV